MNKKLFVFDQERTDFLYNIELKKDKGKKIFKSILNGITISIDYLLSELKEELEIEELHIDGGLTNSSYLAQTQSSISNIPVIHHLEEENTLLGVAFLLGLYKNIWNYEDIKRFSSRKNNLYKPLLKEKVREEIKNIWNKYLFKTI